MVLKALRVVVSGVVIGLANALSVAAAAEPDIETLSGYVPDYFDGFPTWRTDSAFMSFATQQCEDNGIQLECQPSTSHEVAALADGLAHKFAAEFSDLTGIRVEMVEPDLYETPSVIHLQINVSNGSTGALRVCKEGSFAWAHDEEVGDCSPGVGNNDFMRSTAKSFSGLGRDIVGVNVNNADVDSGKLILDDCYGIIVFYEQTDMLRGFRGDLTIYAERDRSDAEACLENMVFWSLGLTEFTPSNTAHAGYDVRNVIRQIYAE